MSVRGVYIGPGYGVPKPPPPPVPPKRKSATDLAAVMISGGKNHNDQNKDIQYNNNSVNARTGNNGIPPMGAVSRGRIPNGHTIGCPTSPGVGQVNCLKDCTNSDCGVTDGVEDHSFHRFTIDVRDPESGTPARIYGNRGSIRGHKNRVRAGIAVLTDKSEGTKVRWYHLFIIKI